MKNDYTLLIFNNGCLLTVQSPLVCLFDTELHSLTGKRMEELFISDTVERLSILETNKKVPFHLCAKSTGCIFNASVEKLKFQKTELIIIYTKENLNTTNSDSNPLISHTALEQLMSDENEVIFQLIEDLRTTRNMAKIDTSMEISEELTDFSQNEKYLLAKKAGCSVNVYRLKNAGLKMSVTYDAYNSYRLYEIDSERKV